MASHTKAHLRKTFQYPDPDDDDTPEALDEEEQQHLITTLRASASATNTLYTRLFTTFPLLLTLAYLPPLSSARGALPLLALTSLIASAWVMYAFPVGRTGWGVVDEWADGAGATAGGKGGKEGKGKGRAGDISPGDQEGPLRKWLVPLNASLVGVILVAGLLGTGGGGVKLSVLPALALGVVVLVKVQVRGVEADVEELEGLRYGYKGA
ncbi:hypothetical protein VC83_03853 [Pseudogymnoascus destructans]|uniref:Uncharacterized protein n=2 Tax=Pseudogymnoascus destructans TaxID=655981 RepID=L8G9G6_PSED2|nr:uncharacterized protein VC83_03853 [Pseudogymnoascus destructans]ELR08666.1 hypothetical protein GMDG_03352 [Pseudogymnoascus destructans 20631-21]OAF59864.2 hypothetical protein VC83_03853 [Pseudogymnoascus destructans]